MLKGTCVILRIFVEPLPKQTVEIAVVEYVYCQIYVCSKCDTRAFQQENKFVFAQL